MAAKPKVDHTRYHFPQQLRDHGLGHFWDAMALLDSKATAVERDDYERFVLDLANKVAAAYREDGHDMSPPEAVAIQEITTALGTAGS